ncbi:hypothetical protein [Fortiea contorta]|uniref:hypothetical protein n=1 Tax=Fortiea contorta TaxID=1892405 RepID=UPI0003790BD3|nr:hypothetical protein [Fortiea contorta]
MAAARKSAVSGTGTWFRRNSTKNLAQGRARRIRSDTPESYPVPANRQRRSSKNLSAAPASTPELTGTKIPRFGFLNLPVMSDSGATPLWLLRFYTLQRYSSVAAFLLVATTLVVYGWSVYSQELWSQGYRRLQNLQRQERQLTTTNAALTNRMAEDAEKPTAGLDSPTSAKTIFLPPAADTTNVVPSLPPNSTAPKQSSPLLGY